MHTVNSPVILSSARLTVAAPVYCLHVTDVHHVRMENESLWRFGFKESNFMMGNLSPFCPFCHCMHLWSHVLGSLVVEISDQELWTAASQRVQIGRRFVPHSQTVATCTCLLALTSFGAWIVSINAKRKGCLASQERNSYRAWCLQIQMVKECQQSQHFGRRIGHEEVES